jgi:hypothetical protein
MPTYKGNKIMITLTEFRKILNKKNDTSETKYLWKCYGQNAKFFDSENISLVYDTETDIIYTISIDTTFDIYRWSHPDHKEDHDYESDSKGFDPDIAYDDVKFIDIELDEMINLVRDFKCQN